MNLNKIFSLMEIPTINYLKKFGVKPGSEVDLSKIEADFSDQDESHDHALPEIESYTKKMYVFHILTYC